MAEKKETIRLEEEKINVVGFFKLGVKSRTFFMIISSNFRQIKCLIKMCFIILNVLHTY